MDIPRDIFVYVIEFYLLSLSPNVHMDVISWKSICWLCQWKWWHKLLVSKWEKWVSQSNTQRYVYHDLYICTQKRLPSTFSINLQHPAIFTFVCRQESGCAVCKNYLRMKRWKWQDCCHKNFFSLEFGECHLRVERNLYKDSAINEGI